MKTPKGKEVFVFDNEGRSFDRFTIVVKEDAMLFGASNHPFHPQGFGQFCGDTGYPEDYIKRARGNPEWLGKETTLFSELPEDVQKYVEQITE